MRALVMQPTMSVVLRLAPLQVLAATVFISPSMIATAVTANNNTEDIFRPPSSDDENNDDPNHRYVTVTNNAMGARCAVAADFDNDGLIDIVSASSEDNAVSWYKNLGVSPETGMPTFGIKREITWSSLGARIVAVADIDGDGDVDVVVASYYDDCLRWYENVDGLGLFEEHLISCGVNEGQGVTVADLDNDGKPDVIIASSGDDTIAVFRQISDGIFCEIKEIVDSNAIGARTVVAADLNGDGWIDLASASKDDDTIAWYPNDGTGRFHPNSKIIISRGPESSGAYSLVAADIDSDSDYDLIVASNENDHVSLWRNVDGKGTFEKTLIYDQADFVLSVTAADFDRDGDVDVASASYFDGHVNWYENLDGKGYSWKKHTIYVGLQGHYVSVGDLDGDGDDDLIAAMHGENSVNVFLARTECDGDYDWSSPDVTSTSLVFYFQANATAPLKKESCCRVGTQWNVNVTSCENCPEGTYGIAGKLNNGTRGNPECILCPIDACHIPGFNTLPAPCAAFHTEGCANVDRSISQCVCPTDTVKDPDTDVCAACANGQIRPDPSGIQRERDTIGNYPVWESQQGICAYPVDSSSTPIILGVFAAVILLLAILFLVYRRKKKNIILMQQGEIRRKSQLLRRREEELNVFRVGTSKFGDAVAFIDSLLQPESPMSDPEEVENLLLVKRCLVSGSDNSMHIPDNLTRNSQDSRSSLVNQYIMKEFAGVSLVGSLDKRSSWQSKDCARRHLVGTLNCLSEFVNLEVSKQTILFELLSFSNLRRWDFNVFDVSAIVEENTLLFVAWAIIASPHSQFAMAKELKHSKAELNLNEGYSFVDLDLNIDIEILGNYCRAIQRDYVDNPYHNAIHAADVVQTLHSLIQMADKSPFQKEELFLAFVASVVHDVKHPGMNNTYQVNSISNLALIYNDTAVLENKHASHAFTLMIQGLPGEYDNLNFLKHVEASKFAKIRAKVVEAVLHTDMSEHFATVAKIKSQAAGKSLDEIDPKLRWEILMYMLHLADISNPAKGDPLFKLWTDRCLEEFFAQGDKERLMGLPISPNCDRKGTKKPDSQIGFINFVVKPAYVVLADIIPAVDECILPVIENNLKYWEDQRGRKESV